MASKKEIPKSALIDAEFFPLHYGFFTHPKTGALIRAHGALGAYVCLVVWHQMFTRNGDFDTNEDFTVDYVAMMCRTEPEVVKEICLTMLRFKLIENTTSNGRYTKQDIVEHLKGRGVFKQERSESGRKGGIKAQANKRLEKEAQLKLSSSSPKATSSRERDREIDRDTNPLKGFVSTEQEKLSNSSGQLPTPTPGLPPASSTVGPFVFDKMLADVKYWDRAEWELYVERIIGEWLPKTVDSAKFKTWYLEIVNEITEKGYTFDDWEAWEAIPNQSDDQSAVAQFRLATAQLIATRNAIRKAS